MSDLTAENLRLRAALEPFAAIDADAPVPEWGVLKAWIGSARAALAGATSDVYGASTIGVLQDKLAAAEAALINDQQPDWKAKYLHLAERYERNKAACCRVRGQMAQAQERTEDSVAAADSTPDERLDLTEGPKAACSTPKKPRVRAWLQREGELPHEMTAEAALNDQVVRIRELQSPTGFREEDDGRVVFPLALHREQAILTVQLAEPTWRHAIQWLRRKYGEDATDEVWAFYAARIADDLEAQERKTDAP